MLMSMFSMLSAVSASADDTPTSAYVVIKPTITTMEDALDGSKTFSVKVEPNWEFFSLMLGFGPGVRILSPNSIVREMKRKIKKAAELYTEPLKDSEDLKTEEE